MIVNSYNGKTCQSCNKKLNAGEGFAYKNGYRWLTCCNSTACMARLGVQAPAARAPVNNTRKLTEDGYVEMPYDRDAITFLRALPGARWEPNTKRWQFSLKPADLPRVIEIADQLQLTVPDTLRSKASEGTAESREALERANRKRDDGATLYGFQKEGVEFLALKDRALLADEMGLGKSIQVLVALPENAAVLLICPASLKYNWQNEFRRWRPDYKTTVCSGRDSFVLPQPGEAVLINYDILPDFLKSTKEKPAVVPQAFIDTLRNIILVADECHLVKNYKSSRATKVKTLSHLCSKVWFLTGTPLMNRALDLYGLLEAGNMNALGGWNKFVQLFNGYKNQWGGYEFGLPTAEVAERMKRVMLRRLKKDVLKDLPAKTYKIIEVNDMSAQLRKTLDNLLEQQAVAQGLATDINDARKRMEEFVDDLDAAELPGFQDFSRVRQLLAESKIPAMLELVESYEESDTPLVVFSAHKAPVLELGKREGWGVITGDVSSEARQKVVDDFQSGKLKGVALTIQAGGVGITLTRATDALFVDMDWTPGLNTQSEDRLHRIGQKNNVLIMHMQSKHPLDRHIQELIRFKIKLADAALERSLNFKPIKPRTNQEVSLVNETEEELQARIKEAGEIAEKEYAKSRIEKIASREALKADMSLPEPELTDKRKGLIKKALDYMIGRCDGAETRDGMGFNKPDAAIAHWIYGTGLESSDEMTYRVTERILTRYYKQLHVAGFDAIWKPDFKN